VTPVSVGDTFRVIHLFWAQSWQQK